MESLAGDFEFFKEFAQDSREVLAELTDQVNELRDDPPQPPPRQSLGAILDNCEALKGSAEFLGLEAIYKIAREMHAFFEGLREEGGPFGPNEEAVAEHSITCLVQLIAEVDSGHKPVEKDPRVQETLALIESSEHTHHEPSYQEIPDDFQITITAEMLNAFTTEAAEQLEQAEASLLSLESNLTDKEALDCLFRAIHTFKGNCGLFNYGQLEQLGHHFETILEDYKSEELKIDQQGVTVMLQVLDALKSALHELPDGKGKVPDFDAHLKMMSEYQTQGHVVNVVGKSNATMLGEILVEMEAVERPTLESALARQSRPIGEILKDMDIIQTPQLEQALEVQRQRREDHTAEPGRKRRNVQNIRVDLYKMDTLINLVGELIIAENMVTNNPDLEGYEFENFKKAAHHLNRISRELQDISMSLRMIPIESTFHKMVRVVRDVSQKQGKLVQLVMSGEDTEVDKNVVELISGPLLHIIRNAIDHGIESPRIREERGKSKTGSISLSASHEGGEVVIEVKDDGNGIDPQKILKKAQEKGFADPHQELKDHEILNFIFEPGFSTADKITDVSGRGVGMDVVRQNIEKISGRINVTSKPGQGSQFSIRIPLTLAIIEGLLVRIGSQLLTLPLLSVRGAIKVKKADVSKNLDGGELVKIREQLCPIIRLHELLSMEPEHRNLEEGILVLVDNEGHQIGLFADEILGQYQTVIKGLSGFFGTVEGISGTSIMSNGDISLILDIPGLVASALKKQGNSIALTH